MASGFSNGTLIDEEFADGSSCCYTSANAEVIGSEEKLNYMVELGAKFAWAFTYMPVGKGVVPKLIATAGQREMMYHKIREYRKTKPLFTIDFRNDGAGGKERHQKHGLSKFGKCRGIFKQMYRCGRHNT